MSQVQSQLPFANFFPSSVFQDFNNSLIPAQNTIFKNFEAARLLKDNSLEFSVFKISKKKISKNVKNELKKFINIENVF